MSTHPPIDTTVTPVAGAGRAAPAGAPATPAGRTLRLDMALLVASLAGVVAIRLHLLASTDFPINDGGLFLAFVEELARTFPRLPDVVVYNGDAIPFAYPPLSFWLSAGAVKLGVDPWWVMHRLPILMNIGYVLAFALLLRVTGRSPLFVAIAVLVFGTSFRSYEWLVMGGGLSRGLGGLLLLGSLLLLMRPDGHARAPLSTRRLVAGGVAVGLTVLTHLEWGLLGAMTALLCLLATSTGPRSYVKAALTVGLTALAVATPWFWSILQTHGLQPFVDASRTGFGEDDRFMPTAIAIARNANVLLPFALVAVAVAIARRDRHDLFWLVFLVASVALTPRHGATPMVLALGVLVASGILTTFRWAAPRLDGRRHAKAGLVLLVVALLAVRTADAFKRETGFTALDAELREAMGWVARTHPGTRFALVTDTYWYYDSAAEWFPVIARAVSTTTVQGREWLPDRVFMRTELLKQALTESTTCDRLFASVQAFGPADFYWVQDIDLAVRAAAIERGSRVKEGLGVRLRDAIERRINRTPLPELGVARSALRGSGTGGGCFDAAGYDEIYANARVRIFRAR